MTATLGQNKVVRIVKKMLIQAAKQAILSKRALAGLKSREY